MDIILIRALQLILCFALLILLHEGGHFLFAKLFKVRVEKFCLFFDPWFTPFKFKPKGSDTTYCIGWLPLGGYVKISGMIDESLDTEQLKQPVKPWEFRAKPAWQRLLIMAGGVLVNFVLAFVIYSAVLYTWGERYVPIEKMSYGFKFSPQAKQLGLRDGDILTAVDGERLVRFDGNVYRSLSEARSVTVNRAGKSLTLPMPGDLNLLDMIKKEPRFVEPLVPSVVDSVVAGSPAARAGVRPGDRVMAFNGTAVSSVNDFNQARGVLTDRLASASHADSLALRRATLVVTHAARAGAPATADTLSLTLGADYMMGIAWTNPLADGTYPTATRHYGLLQSVPAGVAYGWKVLTGYVSDLKYVFTRDGAESVGSFVAIGSLFPAVWDWARFWELTAFISLMLAFMNVLPIPALDGGHIFFLLIEVITRRKPSDRFMERAQYVGMAVLLLLMGLAVFNDFRNFIF